MKKHRNKIIAAAVVFAVLAVAFLWDGSAPKPNNRGHSAPEATETAKTPVPTQNVIVETPDMTQLPEETINVENKPHKADDTPMTAEEKIEWAEQIAEEASAESNPEPEETRAPVEPLNEIAADKELTCTLSVRCDTILENIAWLDEDKIGLVPQDGVIFAEQTVVFYDGESVFDLLMREMKQNKIHMEFTNTPVYNSASVEGINNLYEFDCGELSGWMYKVNGWFPNYGCSRYQLHEGDKVEWVYTCDLGIDVGGYYSGRNGK